MKHRRESHKKSETVYRCGELTPLIDSQGNPVRVGDLINYRTLHNGIQRGRVLVNEYGELICAFCYSKWYGSNDYDINSYGKAYSLRLDHGDRMEFTLVKE